VGRLTRWLAAAVLAVAGIAASADAVVGFDGFGSGSADSTYGEHITFEVELDGGAPDDLELLIRTPGSEAAFVVPVTPGGDTARYVWNTSADYVTPNTLVTYQWRAATPDGVSLSDEATHRYADDRVGLDWQHAQLGEANVHWYGDAEGQALRFGELTAIGVERAEDLLGTELAGPVDVFVYDSREDFFGALGPGAREWTGAAAYSELRTIFMWLRGGSAAYLEVAMLHEVTHVVFHDATDNPYHEPARWLNEGIATWSERSEADDERGIVALEASGAGLFAFEAITEQFPIGERGGRLSYAQGTAMVDMIVDRYGEEALAAVTASFHAEFGVEPPQPVAADPIAASDVDRPPAGRTDAGGVEEPGAEPAPGEAAPGEQPRRDEGEGNWVLAIVGLAVLGTVVAAVLISRRAARRSPT
jgi:hypothetical protein